MKKSFLFVPVLVAVLCFSGLHGVEAADLRFQGRMIDSDGFPAVGNVYLRYGSSSSPTTLAGPFTLKDGKYDFTQTVSTEDYFGLLVYPTDMTPNSYDATRKVDQVLEGRLQHTVSGTTYKGFWRVDADDQVYDSSYSRSEWCGMVFRIATSLHPDGGYQIVAPDLLAESDWCPEDGDEKVQTQVSQSFPQGNLVSNGSFENNYEPSDYRTYERWNTDGLHDGIDFNPIYRPLGTLAPHSGKKAATVTYTAPSSTWGSGYTEYSFLRSDYFPVKPNTRYVLSFYYSAEDPVDWSTHGVRPMVKTFSDKSGTEVFDIVSGRHGATAYEECSGEWKHYVHTFETGPTAVFGGVELLRTEDLGAGGTFYFDDVVVLEESEADQGLRVSNSTVFADGLNRPFLTRTEQPDGKNLYAHTEYDALNRPVRQSLPVNIQGAPALNGFVRGVPDTAANHYDGSGVYGDADGRAFTEKIHDNSPIGRVVEEASSGETWAPGEGHTMRTFYSTTADTAGIADEPSPASVENAKYAYQFMEDEEGRKTREFQDKFGHTVRKSVKLDGSWVNTDYRYDENGNADSIIAPAGPGGTRQISRIRHNTLGSTISDSAGDYGDIRQIYDASNRPRFSQTEAQRANNLFSYIKYDAFGRATETGEYLDDGAFTEQNAAMLDFPRVQHPLRRARTFSYYDQVPTEAADCFEDGTSSGTYLIRTGTTNPDEYSDFTSAYTEATYEISGLSSYAPGRIRFIQVYEEPGDIASPGVQDYEAISILGGFIPFTLTAIPLYQYNAMLEANKVSFPGGIVWGAVKGRLTKTVTCNEGLRGALPGLKPIVKLFNYDKYGNTSAIYEYNGYLEDAQKWRKTAMRYDAQNRVVEKSRYPDPEESPVAQATLLYSYDMLGRLDTVRNGEGSTVAINVYHELGQLSTEYLGWDGVRVEYAYHLHGWPTSIKAYNSSDELLFSEVLNYENGSTPTYNGNISEYFTQMEGDASDTGYYFLYDDLSRLTHAETERGSGEWDYDYYPNGSIDEMGRSGQTFGYTYNSGKNQLNKVTHSGSTPPRDASGTNNFLYDADGRMTTDASKRLTVSYDDALDRPLKFLVKDGGGDPLKAYYMVYDESGNRVSKLEYDEDASWANSKHYFGNGEEYREVSGSDPTSIYAMDGYGRVTPGGYDWVFETYLKNHLGSTAMVYRGTDEVYRTDYEPYGKLRGEVDAAESPLTQKFTTKELDEGLDLTYFGARYYDQDLGVWTSPDAARQYHDLYSYTGGNPVNNVDPDGMYDAAVNEMGDRSIENSPLIGLQHVYLDYAGTRYNANSMETIDLYRWNSLETNFITTRFENLISKANSTPYSFGRVLDESVGGNLDFKNQMPKSLFLANGTVYNRNEAGNFVWSYYLASHGVSGLTEGALAQGGSLKGSRRFDEPWDVSARHSGRSFYNNRLPQRPK